MQPPLKRVVQQSNTTFARLVHLTDMCHLWDICDVVGTVLLYKYWQLLLFRPNVDKCEWSKTKIPTACVRVKLRLLNAFPRLVYPLGADKRNITRHFEGTSTRVVGMLSQWPRKYLASVTMYQWLTNKPVVGKIWRHLASCTVFNYWRDCQIYQAWESGLTF